MEQSKIKVRIAIPTVDGWIHSKLARSVFVQMKGHELAMVAGLVPVELARNTIIDEFMKSDATHLFMVDADTIPPDDAIERLLKIDSAVVTGVTPIVNKDSATSNIFMGDGGSRTAPLPMNAIADREPFEISAVGFACILIRREVFEKIEPPYLTGVWFKDGTYVDGEIHLCSKILEAGFKITVDPSVICGHVKQVTL